MHHTKPHRSPWITRRWPVGLAALLLLSCGLGARADLRLPSDIMEHVAKPWPPAGWSEVLDLSEEVQRQPHRSKPTLGQGYFGQTLYRQIPGTNDYWRASILIQDRGDRSAAWRAVSAIHCTSRNYHGHRARECKRRRQPFFDRTLHYEVGRFYISIQLSGPTEVEYPYFSVGRPPLSPPGSRFVQGGEPR